jgi:hypothetical protein
VTLATSGRCRQKQFAVRSWRGSIYGGRLGRQAANLMETLGQHARNDRMQAP